MKNFPLIIASLLITLSISRCNVQEDFHEKNDHEKSVKNKTEYHLVVGETFTIELYENGSIGFSNCWTNQALCNSIILKERKYISSEREKQGYIGVGGSTFWTFEATAAGVDTLKVEWCPTGRQAKSCAYFTSDSMSVEEDSIKRSFNTHSSASIIVHVKE